MESESYRAKEQSICLVHVNSLCCVAREKGTGLKSLLESQGGCKSSGAVVAG